MQQRLQRCLSIWREGGCPSEIKVLGIHARQRAVKHRQVIFCEVLYQLVENDVNY